MKKDDFTRHPAFGPVKGAQRDLITAVGRIERAAMLVEKSPALVGNWNNLDSPDLMTICDVAILEAELGRPVVSRALAHMTGATVVDPAGTLSGRVCMHAAASRMMAEYAEFLEAYGEAASDGRFTNAELYALRPQADDIRRAVEAMLATIDRIISAALQSSDKG